MRLTHAIFLLFFVAIQLSPASVISQIKPQKIDRDLSVDGRLDEPEWQQVPAASGFWQNFPSDTALATAQTAVRVLYNNKYLYISANVYNARPVRKYVASSLKRDFPFLTNDAFGVILDPFSDHLNGYGFYVSAYGVQREEQIYSGATVDATWDIKWFSAVQKNEIGWTVEIAIPLRYLRYDQALPAWNINFLRNNVAINERSSWILTPRNFSFPNLSYAGRLEFPQPPKRTPDNISFIPGFTLSADQDQHKPINATLKPSLDAKVTVTSSLNLDLTINPDFSQATVDQAQVNLTRFELSYPENRLFFIENSDLFSEFGVSKVGTATIRPFYSRRIGLQYDSATGQYEQTSVIAGARLSGKINRDLRIGVMTVQTEARDLQTAGISSSRYPSQNYSVVAVQQKVFSSSNIGVICTNRQGFGADTGKEFHYNARDYNRLLGVEYNLTSRNGEWTGKLFEERMFDPQHTVASQGGWINYNTRKTISWVGITQADKGFAPSTGYVPRNGFFNPYSELSYILYPKSGPIIAIRPVGHYELYLDSAYHRTDHEWRLGTELQFKNTTDMYILVYNDYTRLLQPYNPALNNGKPLPAGKAFSYTTGTFYFQSDLRRQISGQIYANFGQYYNGHYGQFTGNLNSKVGSYGTVGINYAISLIRLPAPYSNNNVYAIGPIADLAFSRKLFFTSNVQYTSQNNNINFFFRLQWRFRPLSDVFLVYTNNHGTSPWQRENQSFVLKILYFI